MLKPERGVTSKRNSGSKASFAGSAGAAGGDTHGRCSSPVNTCQLAAPGQTIQSAFGRADIADSTHMVQGRAQQVEASDAAKPASVRTVTPRDRRNAYLAAQAQVPIAQLRRRTDGKTAFVAGLCWDENVKFARMRE